MRKFFFTLLLPALLFSAAANGQQPVLSIYKYYGEKSKDSRSASENIIINGNTLSYSAKYTGRGTAGEQEEAKTCTLTDVQLAAINKIVADKNLNRNDSLIIAPVDGDGVQVSAVLSVACTKAGSSTKVKCKGTPSALKGNPLYENSLSLYAYIKNLLNQCR